MMPAFAQYIHILSERRPVIYRAPTREQKIELVRQWKESGLSQVSFAKSKGVFPTTFSAWCRGHYLGEHGKNNQKVSA